MGGQGRLRGTAGAQLRRRALRVPWLLVLLAGCLTPAPTPVDPLTLEPFIERASRARGLRFVRPIQAFLIDPETVGERLEAELGRVIDEEEWTRQFELLKAIGLVAPDSDPLQELQDLQAGSVAGYYAALDDRLYVTSPDPEALQRALASPYVAEILVHELGHALQAHHSRLLEVALGILQPDDLGFALAAHLEGDALLTELRDVERQRGEPLPRPTVYAERFAADVVAGLGGVSPWVHALFLTPYPAGYAWVHRVWSSAGQAGVDRALDDPPMSSAAILSPERGLRGRHELEIEPHRIAPYGECEITTTNAFGRLGLSVWLDTSKSTSLGWKADRAWMIHCGDQRRWAWLLDFEDEAQAAALTPRLKKRARAVRSRASRRGSRVLVSKGLDAGARAALLVGAEERYYPSLHEWLLAHPEVEERLQRVREKAGLAPASGAASAPISVAP